MLPRAHRLSNPAFRHVLQSKPVVIGRGCKVFIGDNQLPISRIGFRILGKTTSVERHRTKRLLREAVRQALPEFPPGTDIVIMVFAAPPLLTSEPVRALVQWILRQLHDYRP